MKLFSRIMLLAVTALLLFYGPSAVAQTNPRTYLPGDFVHIIVEAPVDTSQISATMPDATVVSLIQDRRTNVWRGLWQVPVDFKKGTYSARLSAIDIQGNVFDGQTDSFSIGELSLVTLARKPTPEVASRPQTPLSEVITTEPVTKAAAGQEDLISLVRKLVAQPTAAPAPELTPNTKDLLVARNLAAAKEDIQQGKFSEAAAFLRVVLYLSPDNKEAGALLADTMNRLAIQKRAQAAQTRLFILLLIILIGAAGAILTVWLRRRQVCPPTVASVASESPPAKMKILIADDEEVIRSNLDLILKKKGGYETDFALDGVEAIKKVKSNDYALVLLDVAMPKLDGYEVLRQIRSFDPHLPVVFVTGRGIPQKTIESLSEYNLSGYIEKPFTPEKVLDLVARLVNK